MVKGIIDLNDKIIEVKDIDPSNLQGGEVLLSKIDKDTFALVARKMPSNVTLRVCRVYHTPSGYMVKPTDSFIFAKPDFVKEDWWLVEKAVILK